ncbi:MAG: RNA 2',3'-cyclic phosphodiesterase [Armatimonadetes bacterium]|nr:RNA 2',3'-cyclic phosphodiesterase [Armatimonadota bacterium]
MNHFFALELSDEARRAVAAVAGEWRRRLRPRAAWYNPADYHITLKFLGDVPEMRQPELVAAALPVAARDTLLEIRLRGIGVFPNARRPNVLWVGVQDNDTLKELAAQLDGALADLGFRRETRAYVPHVTLARIRAAHPLGPEDWPDTGERTFPNFAADHFVLMQTLPPGARQKGSPVRYNTVHTFPFGNPHS